MLVMLMLRYPILRKRVEEKGEKKKKEKTELIRIHGRWLGLRHRLRVEKDD